MFKLSTLRFIHQHAGVMNHACLLCTGRRTIQRTTIWTTAAGRCSISTASIFVTTAKLSAAYPYGKHPFKALSSHCILAFTRKRAGTFMMTGLQLLSLCMQYEDELLQVISQSVMPLDRLVGSANSAAALSVSMGEQPARQAEDLLAQELLMWFKHDFFAWVNFASDTMYTVPCWSITAHLFGFAQLQVSKCSLKCPLLEQLSRCCRFSTCCTHAVHAHQRFSCSFPSIPCGAGEQPPLQPLRQ